MKFGILAFLLVIGVNANAASCKDSFGNPVLVKLDAKKFSVVWKNGKSGTLKASGESGGKLYYRNQSNGVAIVEKAILSGGKGRITFSKAGRPRDGGVLPKRFYCNQ